MRSSTPGPKFSTSTSQLLISAVRTSLPLGFLVSSVIERLLWLSMVKYRLSTLGTSRSWPRVMSPTPGRSTLITSAPNQASSCVQVGPDWTWVKSRMRTPLSALVIGLAPVTSSLLSCPRMRASSNHHRLYRHSLLSHTDRRLLVPRFRGDDTDIVALFLLQLALR